MWSSNHAEKAIFYIFIFHFSDDRLIEAQGEVDRNDSTEWA